ncbi:MAG: DUF6089 family protein [Flavobacteriaceae bacterium]|nr:DUF6089 family protein [Flavobacteriaceae bacterium]
MKKYLIILIFFITNVLFSQINELGISLGGSNYIGDIGDTQYINPNDIAVGLVYKWNYSSRVVYRADATYIKIAADDAEAGNAARKTRGYSFKNSVKEFAIGIEYNYYDYSMIQEGWASTPYLIVQLAINNYNVAVRETTPNNYETEGKTSFTIPFGIGYKTKIGTNIGIAIETKVRYTFADDLDYNNPNITPDLTFGNPNSDDWYVTTGITIVLGFGRKACYSDVF